MISKSLIGLLLGSVVLGSVLREDDLVAGVPPNDVEASDARFTPGEVVVRWRAGVDLAGLRAVGGRVVRPDVDDHVSLVVVPRGREVEAAKGLASRPEVLWAEPNYIRRSQVASNDPLFTQQWGLQKIQAPSAWETTSGTSSVTVAVVDTGVDLRHPDLQGKLLTGRNLLQPDAAPQDDGGHGTHVAGTIAATLNNNIGIAGVAAGVSILPVKVLRNTGSGKDTNVAAGIRWATDNGARVINMSFTGVETSAVLNEAVTYAASRNVVLVVAAGNEGSSNPSYPAATEPAIAVAATDPSDRRASFSNFGPWVDVAAPGTDVLSTHWDGGSTYRADSGTSMAAPHVTGVIALLLSVRPGLTIAEIEGILKVTADPLNEPGIGVGRVNAAKAVAAAIQLTPEPTMAPAPGAPTQTRATPTPRPQPSAPPPPSAFSYGAPPASQNVFLPLIRQGLDAWNTEITVQNVVDTGGSVVVQFVDGDGSVPGAVTFPLPPLGSATLTVEVPGLGARPWQGAAVVRAQMPVAAMVRLSQAEGDSAAYEGRAGGSPTAFGPLVFKNRNGWTTVLAIQNLGRETAAVDITYAGRGQTPGTWAESLRVAPSATGLLNQVANPQLPDGFEGSVHLRSTNEQPLALVVLETSSSGGASAYSGTSSGAVDLSAPVLFKNRESNGTWSTGIQLQNVGADPARVRLAYSAADRTGTLLTEHAVVPPGASHTFYQPSNGALPDGFVGAARILVENQQPVVGLVHEVNSERDLSMAYELLGSGDLLLHVPQVLRKVDGQNTSMQVQNRGNVPARVSISYRSSGGALVATQTDVIDAGSVRTYYHPSLPGLPDGFAGSATITSTNGQPLVALVTGVRY